MSEEKNYWKEIVDNVVGQKIVSIGSTDEMLYPSIGRMRLENGVQLSWIEESIHVYKPFSEGVHAKDQ